MPFLYGHKNTLLAFAATLIGAAIPLLPLGIAVTQGLMGLGLVIMLAMFPFEPEARNKYQGLLFNPITFALAFMLIIWLAVTPWSSAPTESIKVISRTAIYIAGAGVIWALFNVRPDLQQRSMKVVISLTFIMLVIACASLLFPDYTWQFIQSATGKTTDASRHFKAFSSALLCLIPILIFGGFRFGGKWRLAVWAMLPAILYVMVATESRSSIAGLLMMIAIVALVYVWANRKSVKIILGAAMLALTSGVSWIWFYGQRYSGISDNYLPTWLVDPHRQIIWRFVFEKFLEAPFTGHGINRINFVPGADTVRSDIGGAVISSHPHNWILEILSETGIFGFGAIAIVLTILAWLLLTRYKNGNETTSLVLIGLSAAFFGSSLFNFSIWSSWWLLTFFVLFAFASAARKTEPGEAGHKKILFVVTEDWAFCSHRLPTAKAAHDAGFDVVVTAREGKHRKIIEELGYKFVPWSIKRKSLNPFYELAAMLDLIRIFNSERPTVAYNVTLKPVIYGSIAARFADTAHTINLFAGLGAWFVSERLVLRFIRTLIMPILRFIHAEPRTWLMVQNRDDMKAMAELNVGHPKRTIMVPGSGIDTDELTPLPEPQGPLTAILLSRMLWDKGVGEAVEAARILKAKGSNIRIVLVGYPDTENPGHVPEQILQGWHDEGVVEWWGRKDDVQAVWAKAHVALLPSYYREGIPRSLLEGAACARPMIGADSPGCRDLVNDGVNGFLVPPRNAEAIAEVLLRLERDPGLRRQLGQAARIDVEENYSSVAIGVKIKVLLAGVMAQS